MSRTQKHHHEFEKKVRPVIKMEEISKCIACGQLDSIYHTSDVGYCTECGTPENYTSVMVDEDGNEVENNSAGV